jgi:hypothetical protein
MAANPNAHRKMTPKGQMSSSGMGPAILHLPPHLKMLFEPNAPLDHLPQLVKRKMPPYQGLTDFLSEVSVCSLVCWCVGRRRGGV